MSYVPSRFNFSYRRKADENVIYNTFSKALVVLSDDEYGQLDLLAHGDSDVQKRLAENGILVEPSFDEMAYLKYFHYKTKFSRETLFLTIAPTLDCNFACPYCYENRRAGKMGPQVQDELITYIRDAIARGVRSLDISWYGGEPLMYVDVVEALSRRISALAREENCLLRMHMVTNGYLLTPKIVDLLDELGVTKIQITLDGLQANHDVRRPLRHGGGTFARIVQNLSLFRESPMEIAVRMNIDRENCADFARVKELVDALQNPNIQVYPSPVEDLNRDVLNEVSAFMTAAEFEAFSMAICDEGTLCADSFSVMDDRFCFCTAETEQCYVVDDLGDFYKCWDEVGRREYRCFNLLDPESMNYTAIAKYLTDDPFSSPKCSACVFLPLCFGGCKFQKAHLNKSVCGFTQEMLEKYIETAFFAAVEGKDD